MQITRQRVRPVAVEEVKDICPTCGGTGKIEPTILLDQEDREQHLVSDPIDRGCKYLKLKVSPYVSAFVHRGLWSLRLRWMWRYKVWLHITEDQSVGIVDARFYDKRGKQLL